MQCPTCPNQTLQMSERQGVEIDYCPSCRGVWLDRGELDKIIERVAQQDNAPPAREPHYQQSYHQQPYRKKKSSLLGELFDF